MHHYQKQKPSKNNRSALIITACMVVTAFSLAFAVGKHQEASMTRYAASNDCTWHDNGTLYLDNRDYTCK